MAWRRHLYDNTRVDNSAIEEVFGLLTAYGQKEAGRTPSTFDRYIAYSSEWQDMHACALYGQRGNRGPVIYPSIGIIWEGEVDDPQLADALCRAYNRWAFELVGGHRSRLYPAAHISMRDRALAIEEMRRVAAAGARTVFVAAMRASGRKGSPALERASSDLSGKDPVEERPRLLPSLMSSIGLRGANPICMLGEGPQDLRR